MRILYLLLFSIFSSGAQADQVENLSELALLPAYCRGTQLIRIISKDPMPIEQYVAIYGDAYRNLHHYCWGLNAENKANGISDPYLRKSKLTYALDDFKYFLDRASSSFSLLPEIYFSRARILFSLKRNMEAVADLNKAIELKANFDPAYDRLSDYYLSVGDKNNAIKILEQGISNTKNSNNVTFFTYKLEKLGTTYQIPTGNVVNEPASVPDQSPAAASSTEPLVPDHAEKNSQADQQAKPNPYCRFCP